MQRETIEVRRAEMGGEGGCGAGAQRDEDVGDDARAVPALGALTLMFAARCLTIDGDSMRIAGLTALARCNGWPAAIASKVEASKIAPTKIASAIMEGVRRALGSTDGTMFYRALCRLSLTEAALEDVQSTIRGAALADAYRGELALDRFDCLLHDRNDPRPTWHIVHDLVEHFALAIDDSSVLDAFGRAVLAELDAANPGDDESDDDDREAARDRVHVGPLELHYLARVLTINDGCAPLARLHDRLNAGAWPAIVASAVETAGVGAEHVAAAFSEAFVAVPDRGDRAAFAAAAALRITDGEDVWDVAKSYAMDAELRSLVLCFGDLARGEAPAWLAAHETVERFARAVKNDAQIARFCGSVLEYIAAARAGLTAEKAAA